MKVSEAAAGPVALPFKPGDVWAEPGLKVVGYKISGRPGGTPGMDVISHPCHWDEQERCWKMLHPTDDRGGWIDAHPDSVIEPETELVEI